ncbi:probable U3 small nucleolar RNA-associated protein 11 isoform X2 [Ptychodera flava]|uniref:probable U3 small nucleolar RNA-associated protein 11 isoform X1 n=1 Tax=Ptychodera flava TaxID=63121 RepID=UPI00396A6516
MSSLKKAAKSGQKTHRERGQLSSRRHLGLLEKKKDYKLRARNFHRKDDYLKALKKKALDKNPEEFYYNMVNSKLVDGVHHAKHKEEVLTDEQKKLMQSQDLRYVTYKKVLESKKIEKLKANLHLLEESEEKPKNKHTFFVDSDREAKKFNLAKRLNTHPELLSRRHNRPTIETLQKARIQGDIDEDSLEYLAKERSKRYKELSSRIDREKELKIVEQKMEVKKNLMDNRKKKEEKKETAHSAAVYKWAMQRKR